MSEQEFQQWALAVIMSVEQNRQQGDEFCSQVEQHDKQAAALLRQVREKTAELSDHLKKKFSREEG